MAYNIIDVGQTIMGQKYIIVLFFGGLAFVMEKIPIFAAEIYLEKWMPQGTPNLIMRLNKINKIAAAL